MLINWWERLTGCATMQDEGHEPFDTPTNGLEDEDDEFDDEEDDLDDEEDDWDDDDDDWDEDDEDDLDDE